MAVQLQSKEPGSPHMLILNCYSRKRIHYSYRSSTHTYLYLLLQKFILILIPTSDLYWPSSSFPVAFLMQNMCYDCEPAPTSIVSKIKSDFKELSLLSFFLPPSAHPSAMLCCMQWTSC